MEEELIPSVDPECPERPRSSDQERNSGHVCPRLVAALKLFLVVGIIVALASSLIFIINLTPNPPTIHVSPIQISNFSVAIPAIQRRTRLAAAWDVKFVVRNPNGRIRLKYGNPSVSVYYKTKLAWSAQIDPFEQKAGDENEIEVRADTRDVIVETVDDIIGNNNGGAVEFDVVVDDMITFYPGSSELWGEQNMTAVCNNVQGRVLDMVNGIKRGVMLDGPRECRVRLPMFL